MLNRARAVIDQLAKLNNAAEISIPQLVEILQADDPAQLQALFLKANEVRQKYCGNEVHLRGIIEFSNYCRCDCLYCGLQRQNNKMCRYRMEPDEIITSAREAYQVGYRTLVLQSGEDPYYTKDVLSYLIKKIKRLGDLAITLSLGEREYAEYAQWKKDGADRYLLKHETADPHLYRQLHPHSSLDKRVECLHWLKNLGYQTGSGFMIGLPGQTWETIAQDLLLLKKLDVEMAGIGPFLPHPATCLGRENAGSASLTLKAVALARIILKRTHLPTTTALEVAANTTAFSAGANVIMRKVEPFSYRKLYEIYPHPFQEEKSLAEERQAVEAYIRSFGLTVAASRGDAIIINP